MAERVRVVSTWSLSKLADFLVAGGWSRTSPTRDCGSCCASSACRFQAVKTRKTRAKTSTYPDYEAKKNRVLHLYAVADGKTQPGEGDPDVVICMDEFGPLNLQPHPGRQGAPRATVRVTRRIRVGGAAGRHTSARMGPPIC